ncbi:hypothetical protein EDB86DRAFT_998529 [Lactarius hatsudake]|nr:hypothetical protein EDB86DRAFT_998529 [Lactarius hatsudake]
MAQIEESATAIKTRPKIAGKRGARQPDSTFGVRVLLPHSRNSSTGGLWHRPQKAREAPRRHSWPAGQARHLYATRERGASLCVCNNGVHRFPFPFRGSFLSPSVQRRSFLPCRALPHPLPENPICQRSNALRPPQRWRRPAPCSADESEAFVSPDRTPSTTGARNTGGEAASPLLQNSSALQEELATQGQLRRNAEHFPGALAADQGVLRAAEEKVGALDGMEPLRDRRGKALGTTCLTISSSRLRFWSCSFHMRRWEMAVGAVMTPLLSPVIVCVGGLITRRTHIT